MPDNDTPTQHEACERPLNYPNPSKPATSSFASLKERLDFELSSRTALSFPEYLEIVLYDPIFGYYAKSSNQVGRAGDFYTSVSVGPLFGKLLARRFLNWWEQNQQPSKWRIIEIGAHDGKLAADILATLASLSPKAWNGLEYATAEPLPLLREAQIHKLKPLAANLRIEPDFQGLSENPLPGIVFGNEILDALPFHIVRHVGGKWKERFITQNMEWIDRDIHPKSPLAEKMETIGQDFPESYQTEVRTGYNEFLGQVSKCITDGMLLFIDYGFAAPEYYDSHRTSGTLRTFSKHKAGEDPLHSPGEIDITAHVDFTDLAKKAEDLGYIPTHFSSQGSYLTHLAVDLIKAGKLNTPKEIAQFQTLTHPGHLGASFHVIEFSKPGESPPEVLHRLAIT